jgi:hypothetical protein
MVRSAAAFEIETCPLVWRKENILSIAVRVCCSPRLPTVRPVNARPGSLELLQKDALHAKPVGITERPSSSLDQSYSLYIQTFMREVGSDETTNVVD